MPPQLEELSTVALLVAAAWPCIVAILFLVTTPQKAILYSVVYGFLFLPNINYKITGFPVFNKFNLTIIPPYLLSWFFAYQKHIRFRFQAIDLLIVFWGFSPLLSSLSNELGYYDGFSISYNRLASYGTAYFLGRIFFSKIEDKTPILRAFFYGGVILLPFVFYEAKMSPTMHFDVYGYHPHEFRQTVRFEGWRPVIFFKHGLQTGLWLAISAVCGLWLFRKGLITNEEDHPTERVFKFTLVITLFIANAITKSVGSILILCIALAILFLSDFFLTRTFMRLGTWFGPGFIALRISGLLDGKWFVDFFSKLNTLRAQSLQFRFDNENLAIQHALSQPFFGWGSWGRQSFNFITKVKALSVYDSLWIITFTMNGFFGLVSMTALYIAPSLLFMHTYRRARDWRQPSLNPLLLGCVVVLMVLFDNLLNDGAIPAYYLLLGSLMEFKKRQ